MTTNPINDILSAPLAPDWTVDGLAERVLAAAAGYADGSEHVLDADALADRQSRRLLRPLLARLAVLSAAESGTPADLYGGRLAFQRPGPDGLVWVLGSFENRPGCVRVALRRSNSPPVLSHPASSASAPEVGTTSVV